MTRISLAEKDLKTVAVIIDNYREIEHQLTDVQQQLEELDSKKTSMLSRLDDIRKEEIEFFSYLQKEYGEGKLDIMTFEYVTK